MKLLLAATCAVLLAGCASGYERDRRQFLHYAGKDEAAFWYHFDRALEGRRRELAGLPYEACRRTIQP